MRRLITFIVALAMYCGLTVSAQASFPWPELVVNPIVATDLVPEVASATQYWKLRGIGLTKECIVQVWWTDAITIPHAVGLGGGCTIAIRKTDLAGIPWTDLERWNLIIHEVGHTFGLDHDATRFPVMDESVSLDVVPLVDKPVMPVIAKKVKKPYVRKHHRKAHRKNHRHTFSNQKV